MATTSPSPKQARIIWLALTALAVTVLLGVIGLAVWAVGWLADRLSALLLPVALALILAYILDPVIEFFVRKKVPRIWAILLVFFLGLGAVGAVLGSVIPGVIRESRRVAADLPASAEKLRSKTEDFLENSKVGHLLPANVRSRVVSFLAATSTNTTATATSDLAIATNPPTTGTNDATTVAVPGTAKEPPEPANDFIVSGLKRLAEGIRGQLGKVSGWLESSLGFVLLPICLFYFLLEKQRINQSWTDYLPIQESRTKDELVFVLRAINDCMIVFFRGQVLVALCVGALLAVGYLILGLNYAVLLGIVAGVLGIVPYLGTIVSFALAITVAAIQFGDWTHPLFVIGIAAAVKLLEDLVISPKIIGGRSGLHPLTVILAVMVGANLLGGFLGALLAIPLTAALRTLMFRYVWKRESGHRRKAAA